MQQASVPPIMLMPPLTYINASEAARTTAGGRGLRACGGRGVGGGRIIPPLRPVSGLEPTEQREKSQACLGFSESRRRKTAGQLTISARGAPETTRHVCAPLRGADVPFRASCFPWQNVFNSLYLLTQFKLSKITRKKVLSLLALRLT